jgi:hypothetical protein
MAGSPFGPSWDALTLDSLRDFFALGEEETLTWECKGSRIDSRLITRAVCGFANSNAGGYLVLGVSGGPTRGGWVLDGWSPPTEALVYVGQVIADTIAPRPPFDVRSFPLTSGGEVTIVEVRPVAVPPAITSSGGVYERLPGQTRQVADPASLRRLFERGEAASGRARGQAHYGMLDLADNQPESRRPTIVVSMASPSLPEDVSLSLFRESVRKIVGELLAGPLYPDYAPPFAPGGGDVSQHALTLWSGADRKEGYAVRLGRHGSVAVSWSDPEESGLRIVAERADRVQKLWLAAASLTAQIGGRGEAYV